MWARMPAPDVQKTHRSRRSSRAVRWAALAVTLVVLAAAVATIAGFVWPRIESSLARHTPPTAAPSVRWPVGVRTVAGSGEPGRADGAWSAARFSDPFGVAVDRDGHVFVADAGDNNAIRRVSPDGRVSVFCGGREGFGDGDAASATFRTPSGLAFLPDGRLVVADTGNNAIRLVGRDGSVTTLAGDGTPGRDDGTGRAARFNGPVAVAVGPDAAVYVADTYNDQVRRIGADGRVTTIAGEAVWATGTAPPPTRSSTRRAAWR